MSTFSRFFSLEKFVKILYFRGIIKESLDVLDLSTFRCNIFFLKIFQNTI